MIIVGGVYNIKGLLEIYGLSFLLEVMGVVDGKLMKNLV